MGAAEYKTYSANIAAICANVGINYLRRFKRCSVVIKYNKLLKRTPQNMSRFLFQKGAPILLLRLARR